MRLLIAVDSIITLDILLKEIASRSWPSGSEARVLSIVEDADPTETWREERYSIAAVRKEMERRGEQLGAMAAQRLGRVGISANVTVSRGNVSFLIPYIARTWAADLILIRSHNRTDSRNEMLGSVAKSVVENAPCSVEVIRASSDDSIAAYSPLRILLATDGSNTSIAAAQALAEENWPKHTEVKIVTVVDPVIYSLEEIGLCREKATKRAHVAIGDSFRALANTSLRIMGEIIAGGVSRAIINRARTWRADLIVVGTRERRGWKRLLFGSVSAAVASRAHCSVRVVRGHNVSRDLVGSSLIASNPPTQASWPARDFGKRQAA